jgi:predicted dehydrogenase
MVGGGGASNFFGGPHRTAILMDNTAELTAGALRRDPQGSLDEAKRLHFTRGYPDYQTMFREEAALPADQRIDYVTVVTPNVTHYEVAKAALEAGIPVLCEKPLTFTLDQSKDLVRLADETGLPFIVAYTYTALPMVMLAREMVNSGEIGEVRKVEAWYPQGWLATRLEDTGMQQVAWRVDPAIAGPSNCGGDIGTHAYEFCKYVAGRTAVQVQARMPGVVQGRVLDDDFTVLARLDNGGIATFTASQITVGALNDNGFRVIGSKGRVEWNMMDFMNLYVYSLEGPLRVYRLGGDPVPPAVQPYLRLPGGHPEGFHEALANLHKSIQLQILKRNGEGTQDGYPFPGVRDGAAGIAFIEACVKSHKSDGAWTDVSKV